MISAQVESVEQAFTNDTTMRNFVAAPIHSRCGKTFGKDLGDGLLERDLGPGVAEAGMVASDTVQGVGEGGGGDGRMRAPPPTHTHTYTQLPPI